MDKETIAEIGKIATKVTALLGGIYIANTALVLGYDGYLAVVAVVGLFAGEKALTLILEKLSFK